MNARATAVCALSLLLSTAACLSESEPEPSTDPSDGAGGTPSGGDSSLFCQRTLPFKIHSKIKLLDAQGTVLPLPDADVYMHMTESKALAYKEGVSDTSLTVVDFDRQTERVYLFGFAGSGCVITELSSPLRPLEPCAGLTEFSWDQFSGETKTIEGLECHLLTEPIVVEPQFEGDEPYEVTCVNQQHCVVIEQRWESMGTTLYNQIYDLHDDFEIDGRFDEPTGCVGM